MGDEHKSDKSSGGENRGVGEHRVMSEGKGDHERKCESIAYIPADGVMLEGKFTIPAGAEGMVLFVDGDVISRHSPRNRQVASVLNRVGFATLSTDLLTEEEEVTDQTTQALRFDIDLLARRVVAATRWLENQSATSDLAIGYFGTSTGTAAALVAAAQLTGSVSAIVSWGGRPDLAGMALHKVLGPILLMVRGDNPDILALNRAAYYSMPSEKKLVILPKGNDLSEELKRVAELATGWFERYLATPRQSNAA